MGKIYKIKNLVILIVIIAILFFNSVLVYGDEIGIENGTTAYLLGDFESGEILEEYNIDKPMEIASITKLMTYLVVMDEVKKGNISLDDFVYIDKEVEEVKGSSFDLKEGEVFTVQELIEALIVISANDGAVALAKYIAGNELEFVGKMNGMAKKLGLKNTLYFNSTGLPQDGVQNIMSPEDIFTLARHIIKKYPEILTVASLPYIEVKEKDLKIENTNYLIKELDGVDGLKTGFTDKAGYCLVSTMKVGNEVKSKIEDFRFIGIVMGTKNEEERKELSKQLLQYGVSTYHKENIVSKKQPVKNIKIPNSKKEEVSIYPIRNVNILRKKDDRINKDIILKDNLKAPLKKGDKVGLIRISKDNGVVDEVDLIVKEDYKKAFFLTTIFRYLKNIF